MSENHPGRSGQRARQMRDRGVGGDHKIQGADQGGRVVEARELRAGIDERAGQVARVGGWLFGQRDDGARGARDQRLQRGEARQDAGGDLPVGVRTRLEEEAADVAFADRQIERRLAALGPPDGGQLDVPVAGISTSVADENELVPGFQ